MMWFMTDPRGPSTVKSTVWISSGTHMLQILWSTVPTKSTVCWRTYFVYGSSVDFLGLMWKGRMKERDPWWPYERWKRCHFIATCAIVGPLARTLNTCCWIAASQRSLWTEVVVCTVWGSVILPHTGANCTSDCLAHGWAISSDPLAINVMYFWGFIFFYSFFLCCNSAVALLFLKIRSGTSPFMTTNTSATFLVIVKGESCLYCIVL